MIPLLAAVAGIIVAAFWYARREELVDGRFVASVLRATAIFLILSAWFLPALSEPPDDGASTAALVDASLSMAFPAAGAETARFDSSLALLSSLDPDTVFTFGADVTPTSTAALDSLRPVQTASRASPGVEAAALSGVDSLWILTDGDLDDRVETRRAAERVGVGLREIRVGRPVTRIGIQDIQHPLRIGAGDTLELHLTLVAVEGQSPLPDSVYVTVTGPDGSSERRRAPVASPGRVTRTRLTVVTEAVGPNPVWRRYDVGLEDGADPFSAADKRTVWVEVTPGTKGVVVVALDPDWEAAYLKPVLDRSSADGVRAYVRIGSGRFVRVGSAPGGGLSEADLRQNLGTAALVVVQARPDGLPAWLTAAVSRAPAVLYLARGTGTLPGTTVTIEQVVDGEWYVGNALPASPLAGLFAGLSLADLPPLTPLYGTGGTGRWSPLLALRDRRGAPRPVVVAGVNGDRRWAVVLARGTWRWAARGGATRQVYRALYAGLAGWLLEGGEGERVELVDPRPDARAAIGWRIAPDVSDLAVTLWDSSGAVVWSDTLTEPDSVLLGPILPAGEARFEASGLSSRGRFRTGRPFSVSRPEGELLPRRTELPIELLAADTDVPAPRRRAVWPFALAAALLCAEWIWRRRIGLR